MRLAGEEARALRHSFVGTEHILLALFLAPEGRAAQVLGSFGVDHAQVRRSVIRMMGLGLEPPEGELALTDPAQDVLDRARREASIRDEPEVGTGHILLALVRKPNGAAARILLELDADPDDIRSALAS